MKAMVLAAGFGARFGSITQTIPKPMVMAGGRPLIEHTILKLKYAGFSEIVINVHWLGEVIKNFVKKQNYYGIKIHVLEERPFILGTGGGIKNALPLLGKEPFWLFNSDVLSSFIPNPNKKLKSGIFGHLVLVKNPPHHKQGDFCLKGEKVYQEDKENTLTYSGISLLSPNLFVSTNKKSFPLEPILSDYSKRKFLTGEFFKGQWLDVGTPERLLMAQEIVHNCQKP